MKHGICNYVLGMTTPVTLWQRGWSEQTRDMSPVFGFLLYTCFALFFRSHRAHISGL